MLKAGCLFFCGYLWSCLIMPLDIMEVGAVNSLKCLFLRLLLGINTGFFPKAIIPLLPVTVSNMFYLHLPESSKGVRVLASKNHGDLVFELGCSSFQPFP